MIGLAPDSLGFQSRERLKFCLNSFRQSHLSHLFCRTSNHYRFVNLIAFRIHSIQFHQARKLYRSMVLEKIRFQAAIIIAAYFTGWKVNEEWTFIWTLSDNRNLSRCHFFALPITIVLSIWFPFAFHSISLGPQTLQMHGHWKDTQTGGDYNRSLFYRLEGELRVKYLFLVKLLSKTLLARSVSKFLAQIIVGEELGYRNVFNTRKGWGENKRYNFFRKRGGGKIRGSRRKRRDPPAPFSVHFNLQSIIADQWTVASFQTEFFFFMIRLHYWPRNHARFE